MRQKTSFTAMIAALVLSMIIILPGTSFAQKKPVVLRLVVSSPAGDWPMTFMNDELSKRFNARAKGEYMMEVHPGGALAKLPEYFDAVRVGAVEMACAPWTMFSFLDRRLAAVETPFLFNNNEAATYGLKLALPLCDRILQEKFNAKGLGFGATDASDLFTTGKPVRTLEDWKGLLTAALSPVTATVTKDLGGSPVTIMWTDMYESLQKKVVNGAIMGTHGGLIMSLPGVCKTVTIFYGTQGPMGMSINLDIWKKMPPQIQKILQEEVQASMDWFASISPKLKADDIKAFREKGMEVYILPRAERERWAKAASARWEKELASFGELGARIREIADKANKKYPYTGK